jgi:hypothetical protein
MDRTAAGGFREQDIDARFATKWVQMPNGCRLWTGARSIGGYGFFKVKVGPRQYRQMYAHVWAYERYSGPVPDGYHLDHLCHTLALARGECMGGDTCLHRRCVNYAEPGHLEPVSPVANVARSNHITKHYATRTACGAGHPYTPETTRILASGHRQCRICDAERARASKRAKRTARTDPAKLLV